MKKAITTTIGAASLAVAAVVATVSFTGCSGDRYHRSAGAYVDDKTIDAKIKSKLVADPIAKATEIKVESYNGQVQLSGFVDTQEQKQRAEEIARGVSGVVAVQNNLAVKPEPAGSPKP